MKALLEADNLKYQAELEAAQITPDQRIADMRERVKQLKQKKEQIRQDIVSEKLLQKWRNDCDDLRSLNSKMLEKQCSKIRDLQVAALAEKRVLELEKKKYFDHLWELDRLKKLQREEQDKFRREQLDRQCLEILRQQIEFLKAQRQQEAELKKHEALLNRQAQETLKIEEERAHQEKLREQAAMRKDLDDFNKKKLLMRQEEMRLSLESDLAFIAQLLEQENQDREEKSRKRAALRQEMLMYREHLMEEQEKEKHFQKQLEKMYEFEAEKAWKKRAETWIKEIRARDKLMKEVIETRKMQIQYKCEFFGLSYQETNPSIIVNQNQAAQFELAKETASIQKSIQDYLNGMQATSQAQQRKIEEYRHQLDTQIEGIQVRRGEEKARKESELEQAREREYQYQYLLEQERERILAGIE